MKAALILTVLTSFASAQSDFNKWENLHTTWGALSNGGAGGFNAQPRTEPDAIADGWRLLSRCGDVDSFPGTRYASPEGLTDLVVIFDVNGYIAGVQTFVPLDKTANNAYFNYDNSPYYVREDFMGEEVYYATAYFVDPSIICAGGRSPDDFEVQGTGYTLIFQTGTDPNLSENQQLIPRNMDTTVQQGVWYLHYCFPNMGYHFFQFYYDVNQPCDDVVPYQLVYWEGELNGFVYQHIAALDGEGWEAVTRGAVVGIVDTPPSCLFDLIEEPGVTTLHVYVGDYAISCP